MAGLRVPGATIARLSGAIGGIGAIFYAFGCLATPVLDGPWRLPFAPGAASGGSELTCPR